MEIPDAAPNDRSPNLGAVSFRQVKVLVGFPSTKKARFPMLAIFSENVKSVMPVLSNTLSLMSVTDDAILLIVSFEQNSKARTPNPVN